MSRILLALGATQYNSQPLHSTARRAGSLTKADAAAQKAKNLIRRNFTAAAPNRKWLTDITQVTCADGKLYIAAMLDCYNGEIWITT